MRTEQFIVFGYLAKEKGKAKCGDFFLYREIKDENIIILTLADGVGSRHHDFVASEVACNAFIDSFINGKSRDFVRRFELALKKADNDVSNPSEYDQQGMMSTIVGAAWDMDENYFLYDSIGDSRLYLHSSRGLEQISRDSKKAVNMRDGNGKLLIQDGVLVIREGLTNALGYSGADISVKKQDFHAGNSIILCTDGIYSIDDFENSITNLLASTISEKKLEKYFTKNMEYFEDDACMLILQRTDHPDFYMERYKDIIDEGLDYRQSDIISHLLTNCIQTEILTLIKSKNEAGIKKLSDYIKRFELYLTEEFIDAAIQAMKTNEFVIGELYQLLIKQLREIKW